jgi:hypothetical protein
VMPCQYASFTVSHVALHQQLAVCSSWIYEEFLPHYSPFCMSYPFFSYTSFDQSGCSFLVRLQFVQGSVTWSPFTNNVCSLVIVQHDITYLSYWLYPD